MKRKVFLRSLGGEYAQKFGRTQTAVPAHLIPSPGTPGEGQGGGCYPGEPITWPSRKKTPTLILPRSTRGGKKAAARIFGHTLVGAALAALLLIAVAGCMVGPAYHQPEPTTQPEPMGYKESPDNFKNDQAAWKPAQPEDAMLRGSWWLIFHDPELNGLEDQLNINNNTIKQYFENYMEARALVAEARSELYPTVSINPVYTKSRSSANLTNGVISTGGVTGATGTVGTTSGTSSDRDRINTFASIPLEATWEPDLWGKIRSALNQATYNAQLTAADLENERLAEQSSLAVYYFELRAQDALAQTYTATVAADQQQLNYTKNQFETGIGTQISVVQAQNTLQSAESLAAGVGVARAQYEHAIAVLIGRHPSQFSLAVKPMLATPPPIPLGVPSKLLERRPDIAEAERTMAAANAQVGIAYAAYYPDLTLTAEAGFESTAVKSLLDWPSRFWSIGPSVSYTIFDAGLRRATVDQYVATYNADLFAYRATVLTAFEQVEDDLAAVRILANQSQKQQEAVASAQKALDLEIARYQTGIDPYVDVVVAQNTLLTQQQSLVSLRAEEITDAVQLVAALGGGWDRSQLPTTQQASQWPSEDERAIQH